MSKIPNRKNRKMPKKGSQITIIHDGTYDLTRIKEIVERYGLDVEFVFNSTLHVMPSLPS